MIAGSYAPKSIATYMREVRYIIEYYPDQSPYHWKDTHITQYLHYLKTTFNVSKAKCRSFATHMLDSGVDIHTIKELLGHGKIETSMVYIHLQTSKRNMLVSPLDTLDEPANDITHIPRDKKML
jgi:site-specific recombinase XerD